MDERAVSPDILYAIIRKSRAVNVVCVLLLSREKRSIRETSNVAVSRISGRIDITGAAIAITSPHVAFYKRDTEYMLMC
jgi:hypothetical protein